MVGAWDLTSVHTVAAVSNVSKSLADTSRHNGRGCSKVQIKFRTVVKSRLDVVYLGTI